MNNSFIHVLNYGQPGSSKTTFASTFPKPLLVWFFDPYGKDTPYLKLGKPTELQDTHIGYKWRDVLDEQGTLLARIEYFHDHFAGGEVQLIDRGSKKQSYNVMTYQPLAYAQYLSRMAQFDKEREWWQSVVLDSATFMELAARKWEQYMLNPDTSDPRQWWAKSTDHLEEMLMCRYAGLPMNVIVTAHVDHDKDELHGYIVKRPSVPGRLGGRLPSAFQEVYRSYIGVDQISGAHFYALQTQLSEQFMAQSQIDAPNPCLPNYNELWANWR